MAFQTYFILASGRVKIGKAVDPLKRIPELQTGNGHALQLLGTLPEDVETRLHLKFGELRTMGEWFKCEQPLVDFLIANLTLSEELQATLREHARVEQPLGPQKPYDYWLARDDIFENDAYLDCMMRLPAAEVWSCDKDHQHNDDCLDALYAYSDDVRSVIDSGGSLIQGIGVDVADCAIHLELRPITNEVAMLRLAHLILALFVLDAHGVTCTVSYVNEISGKQFHHEDCLSLYPGVVRWLGIHLRS